MTHVAATLTWPRVQSLAESGAVALLPVGSTEAHGPHLPLNVDVVIAEEVCRRVATRLAARHLDTVIFPAVPYGLTDFAASFAGTVSLSADTTRGLLSGVLEGIAAHGFKRIAVINHHLEPAHFAVVHEAAKLAREKTRAVIVVPDHRKKPHGPRLGDEFTKGGSHAGFYETSLMLAAAPQLVDDSARRVLPELAVDLPAKIKAGARNFHECGGTSAYFGAPAAATADDGHRLLDILAEISEAALMEAST
ncbi:MAG: creatininase family protein [Myxococcaceae bacterium]|nr:creatininase family protein [Myxococcaceae bacterium]